VKPRGPQQLRLCNICTKLGLKAETSGLDATTPLLRDAITHDLSDDDFAVAVLIGGRCCFFHQGGFPSDYGIPPLANFPELDIAANNPRRRQTRESTSSLELWTEASINAGDVVDSVRQRWVPINEGGQDDGTRPLSVHEAGDRARICEALVWVQGLAQKRGDDETTRFG
jgi:hypothetical protein